MDNQDKQKPELENEHLTFLEGGVGLRPAEFDDIHILKEASHYNIDLENIEKFNVTSIDMAAANNITPILKEEPQEHQLWQDLDVNLADMVSYVLDSSERPIVMVSDDKIAYINLAAIRILELKNIKNALGETFLTFVDKSDWNLLAANIGEMLTEAKKLKIKLKSVSSRVHSVEFQAIYLPDSSHFSFILIGGHEARNERPVLNNLYDDKTGLPSFFLFEDRVQMAINNENYKDIRLPKDMVAVAAISIENIDTYKALHLEDFAIRKIANTLVLSLKKNYTVARGLKYQFWILMPDIINEQTLELELEKIQAILKEGVSDNFTTHEIVYSIGISVFPEPARSAKKLIEQTISAVKKAGQSPESNLVMYDGQ